MTDNRDDGFDPDAGRDLSEATMALPPHVGDLGPDASGKPRQHELAVDADFRRELERQQQQLDRVLKVRQVTPDPVSMAVTPVEADSSASRPPTGNTVSHAGISETDLGHIQETRQQLGLDETDLDYAAYQRLYEREQNPRVSPNAGRYDFDREAAMAPVDPAHVESMRVRYHDAVRPGQQVIPGTPSLPLPAMGRALRSYINGLKAGLAIAPHAKIPAAEIVGHLEYILDNN